MKYQIVFLGKPWRKEEIKSIKIDFPDIVFPADDKHIDENYPFLCLFFGNSKLKVNNGISDDKLECFVKKRNILPIAHNQDEFKTKFPEVVKRLNGFVLDDTMLSLWSLKNYIISFFGLLEGTRKVFISYRRLDSTQFAHKLYDELIKKGYRSFLDSYSIDPGRDFQEDLRHELVDSDIIIILDTPGFNGSDYCMEEFNIANSERIPVVDVRFNIDKKKNKHQFCEHIEINITPDKAAADKKFLDKVLLVIERSRANAFCLKRKFVVDEFNRRCSTFGMPIVEQGGFFRCDITHECFFPITHYPSIDDLYNAKTLIDKTPLFSTYSKQILYNGNYCRPDVISKLNWLNEYLPYKTYNVTK